VVFGGVALLDLVFEGRVSCSPCDSRRRSAVPWARSSARSLCRDVSTEPDRSGLGPERGLLQSPSTVPAVQSRFRTAGKKPVIAITLTSLWAEPDCASGTGSRAGRLRGPADRRRVGVPAETVGGGLSGSVWALRSGNADRTSRYVRGGSSESDEMRQVLSAAASADCFRRDPRSRVRECSSERAA